MYFNLDHLRAFVVVARTGNLSTAAKELGTTQPNLGRQMTALSKEFNLELFFRHSRGVSLTKQGEEFLALWGSDPKPPTFPIMYKISTQHLLCCIFYC
jgi:DNA-binding transcriptional LysR family regulator